MVTYEHLQELQRFAQLGRMSAGLLHEIGNPLTAAMLNLELSDKQSSAVRQARRNLRLVQRYVESARRQVCQQGQAACFGARTPLEELKRVVMPLARKAGVKLHIGQAPVCRLYGDPVKFQQIISNLVINAIQAYGDNDSRVRPPLVRVVFCRDESWLTIQVVDRGQGIAPEALPRIFEAFYTTKQRSGSGLGIGLAIVKQYVTDDFEGTVRAVSSRRRGTRFIVKLPLYQD